MRGVIFGPFIQRSGLALHTPSHTRYSPKQRMLESVPYTVVFARNGERLARYRTCNSGSIASSTGRGLRPFSQLPQSRSLDSMRATEAGQIPRARYSSTYASTKRSHLLIAEPPKTKRTGGLRRPDLYVIELNNMTPDKTLSGAGNGPEPN